MTDLEKPKRKPRAKKKPPTQTAGVTGIDGHGAMGAAPIEVVVPATPITPTINWFKLVELPPFEMFVSEQSGLTKGVTMSNWVKERRSALGDEKLYKLYADWHTDKGYWINETPDGKEL